MNSKLIAICSSFLFLGGCVATPYVPRHATVATIVVHDLPVSARTGVPMVVPCTTRVETRMVPYVIRGILVEIPQTHYYCEPIR